VTLATDKTLSILHSLIVLKESLESEGKAKQARIATDAYDEIIRLQVQVDLSRRYGKDD